MKNPKYEKLTDNIIFLEKQTNGTRKILTHRQRSLKQKTGTS